MQDRPNRTYVEDPTCWATPCGGSKIDAFYQIKIGQKKRCLKCIIIEKKWKNMNALSV